MKSSGENKSTHRPFVVPDWLTFLLLPIIIPLALIACPLSIVWTKIYFIRQRKKEQMFANRTATANRSISSEEAWHKIDRHEGTLVSEQFVPKGPHRFWWTPEDIPRMSPYVLPSDRQSFPFQSTSDEEFDAAIPFYHWAFERYLNPEHGSALLVAFTGTETESAVRPFSSVPRIIILSQLAGTSKA